jgi:hypothetical protein
MADRAFGKRFEYLFSHPQYSTTRMRPIVRAAFAMATLLLPSACMAWGGQLVSRIAEEMLTPQAKAAAKDLLEGANISDAAVVNWADEIRRARRETSSWHYVNIPHDAQGFDRERDRRDGANIVEALEQEAKVLADKTQPRDAYRSSFVSANVSAVDSGIASTTVRPLQMHRQPLTVDRRITSVPLTTTFLGGRAGFSSRVSIRWTAASAIASTG